MTHLIACDLSPAGLWHARRARVDPRRTEQAAVGVGSPRSAEFEMMLVMPHDLQGLRVVVTAGGTIEPIDPVRVITNRSTGKMGFALARAASERAAAVTLVSSAGDGGVPGARHVPVDTVASLRAALIEHCVGADILIMAAAVSDYRVANPAAQKIKKSGPVLLELEPVPDFMHELPTDVFKVGFAAETERLQEHANAKFDRHGFELVCANDVSRTDAGFAVDTNQVTIVAREGVLEELPLLSKIDTARRIIEHVVARHRRWRAGTDALDGLSPR